MSLDPCGSNPIRRFLEFQDCIVLDGGLATELEARGFDLADELWSARLLIENPEAIRRLHFDYLEAGADCIVSASYQATVEGFARWGIDPRAAEGLLRRSVELALVARDDFWSRSSRRRDRVKPLVAASVGPYGAFRADGSEYTGKYDLDEAGLIEFHRRRLEILAAAGADLLACETIPNSLEAQVLARLLSKTPGPPAWFSFCCRDSEHLSDGSELVTIVRALEGRKRVVAVGVNCTAPDHIPDLIERLREVTEKPIVVYPNSGETWDGVGKHWRQRASPVDLGDEAMAWHHAGARLIGGCCRIGPEDVCRIRSCLLRGSASQKSE